MLKALSQILLFVKNPHESAQFYQKLGLQLVSEDENSAILRINWFKIWCLNESSAKYNKDSKYPDKGRGVFIYFSVDDVDKYHQELLKKGLTPSSEPTDQPWGNREFAIKDPNGYKLVFYQSA